MRAAIHRYLIERPGGATPHELLDLVFTQPGVDREFGPKFIRTLLEGDPRFMFRSTNQRWIASVHASLAKSLADTEFVVVDLETTGGSPSRGDTIIEIGAVLIDRARKTQRFSCLVDPGRPLPRIITQLTGITDDMLVGQPRLADVLPTFMEFIGDRVLVAHNARFDLAFLDAAARACLARPLHQPHLCTLRLARRLLPRLRRRGLDAVAAHFGIPLVDRHRALGDAMIAAEILVQFLELLESQGITRLDGALAFQASASDGRVFLCPLPRAAVDALPQRPGVYRFYGEDRRLLYIGKAKNLRQRVGHYLSNAERHSRKTLDLIRHIHDVRAQEAGSELEASLMEAEAIRAEKPPYNRLSKHLPRIAFLKLSVDSSFPRLLVTSRPGARDRQGGRCFGPFRSRESATRVLELITRLYGLRTCTGRLQPDPTATPCFQGQVGACTAPCAARANPTEYAGRVAAFLNLMAGASAELEQVRKRLAQQREEQADALRFEAAGRTQRDLEQIEKLVRRQRTLGWVVARQHLIVLQPTVRHDAALVYLVLSGRLVERRTVRTAADLLPIAERASRFEMTGATSLSPEDVDGTAILAAWLRDRGEREGVVIGIEDPSTAPRDLSGWEAALTTMLASS